VTPRGCKTDYCATPGAKALLASVVLVLLASTSALATEEIYVDFGSAMVHLPNSANPGIGMAWTAEVFPGESSWTAGTYGVGFESSGGAENLLQTNVVTTARSVFTRTTFNVADRLQVNSLFFGCDYDDACAAWLNGVEIYRSSTLPAGALDWDTPLLGQH